MGITNEVNDNVSDAREAATCLRQDERLVSVDMTLTWSPPGPDTINSKYPSLHVTSTAYLYHELIHQLQFC